MPSPAACRAITKRFGGLVAVNQRSWSSPRAPSSASSGPMAQARRPSSTSSPASSTRPTGRSTSAAARWSRGPSAAWLEPFFWVGPAVDRRASSTMVCGRYSRRRAQSVGVAGWSLPRSAAHRRRLLWASSARRGTTVHRARSASSRRPAQRHGRGRHRPHVPEHPPVPEHDRARERAGRACTCKLHSNIIDRLISTPRQAREEEAARRPMRELLALVGLTGRDDVTAAQPAVRRPAPPGDRARARQRAGAPAAGRADGGHEPQRDRGDDARSSPSCGPSWA